MAARSELSIHSAFRDYVVEVGAGTFPDLFANTNDVVVVVDARLTGHLPELTVPVLQVHASENTKTLGGCERLVLAMLDAGVRREHHVVAVGGGMVQDVATFVTHIYMRGLSWTYVPTTLMAMADSCIGGKSSINVAHVKNLVGGFHPPDRVVVDPTFLNSLPASAISAGLAEAAKITFCRGDDVFRSYLDRHSRFGEDPASLLLHVLAAKAWFIEIDEHDQKERRLLNFGHTFGHALETAVDHSISHGAAVAVGLLCAIAHPCSGAGPGVDELEGHCRGLLSDVSDLRASLGRFDRAAFEKAFRSDKKHSASTFHLILPALEGGVSEVVLQADATSWRDVQTTVDDTLASLGARAR